MPAGLLPEGRGAVRTGLRIAACIGAALWVAGSLAAQEAETRQPIHGTGVSLVVPPGFRSSEDFPGIGRAEDLSSVMVTELDVPLSISNEAFSQDALERRGLEMHKSESVSVEGHPATRVFATQHIGNMNFRKWFLLLGNDTHSVLITATTPVESEEKYRDVLLHVLDTAHWDASHAATAAPSALPFQVKESPPLHIVRSASDSVVLTDAAAVKGHVAPVVTVGVSRATVDVGNLAAFAKSRLDETASLDAIHVESEQAHALAALPGHEITAAARDTETGRPVRVRQILASDGSRYYLVQGIFDSEDAARLLPAFDAVAASFALPPPGAGPSGAAGAASAPGAAKGP